MSAVSVTFKRSTTMTADIESLVREYVAGWRRHDQSRISAIVTDDCEVVESDGTTYSGRTAILRWIDQWIESGSKVEQWEICSLLANEVAAYAEWQFTCLCRGNRTSFPGASVFRIRNGKIASVTEYRRDGTPNGLSKAAAKTDGRPIK